MRDVDIRHFLHSQGVHTLVRMMSGMVEIDDDDDGDEEEENVEEERFNRH